MNWIIEKFVKSFILKQVIARLEAFFAGLPQDDAKTINGVFLACLGLVIESLPTSSPYVQPVLDYLHTLPAVPLVVGGVLWTSVGIFHKMLKWIVKIGGLETAKEKKTAVAARTIIGLADKIDTEEKK